MNEDCFLAIDRKAFPSHDGTLVCPVEAEKHPDNPVLTTGQPGSPDDHRCQASSVVTTPNGYRLYYRAAQRLPGTGRHTRIWPAVAFSDDAIHWDRPALGLVEFAGSRANNLVAHVDPSGRPLAPGESEACLGLMQGNVSTSVWHDPADTTAPYRAATLFVGRKQDYGHPGTGHVAGVWDIAESRDGLTFTVPQDCGPIVTEFFEGPRLFQWQDRWFLCGQIGDTPRRDGRGHGRQDYLYYSDDLTIWTRHPEPVLGMDERYPMLERHVGIAATPYGRILIGFAGLFHSHPETACAHMELSLVFSYDGIAWQELEPVMPFIRRGDAGRWDDGRVCQVQGLVRRETDTVITYTGGRGGNAGDHAVHVGAALLRRDGFAFITLKTSFGQNEPGQGRVTTMPLKGVGGKRLVVNADNLTEHQTIAVAVVDDDGADVPGYGEHDFQALTEPGLDLPARWGQHDRMPEMSKPLSLRFVFRTPARLHAFCPRLYAFYIR